jgi:hypothetical protein
MTCIYESSRGFLRLDNDQRFRGPSSNLSYFLVMFLTLGIERLQRRIRVEGA